MQILYFLLQFLIFLLVTSLVQPNALDKCVKSNLFLDHLSLTEALDKTKTCDFFFL